MKRGAWHQFGDRSQKLALEMLENGAGVGVILSPRDLSFHNATKYAEQYRAHGAEVLIDPQFYIPDFSNNNLASYPTSDYRTAVSKLQRIGDAELSQLAAQLQIMNEAVGADAVVAPAVVYQAGNNGIAELNSRLFTAAKIVGDELGVPTYGTVVLGRSVAASKSTLEDALSAATALNADGWYYAFEFDVERVPSSREAVYRCCAAGLTLSCSGKPVLHGYSGFLALLSLGFGATGAAIGHSQNLWRFSPGRWQVSTVQGGGGDAPPRLFSTTLWGTIVHPDETVRLPADLVSAVVTHSPFSGPGAIPPADWSRWQANKHLVFSICDTVQTLATSGANARHLATSAQQSLLSAAQLYKTIEEANINLKDDANAYHVAWMEAILDLLNQNADDFDFLDLL